MTDISKCIGHNTLIVCPMKDSCYRFTATANDFWQSYFMGIPLKISEDGVPSCENYWNNKLQ